MGSTAISSAPVSPSRARTEEGPENQAWREPLIRAVAVIAVLYGAYWILWRWTNTMNTAPNAIVPSLVLLLAETWAYIGLCFFVLLTWRLTNREPGPGGEPPVRQWIFMHVPRTGGVTMRGIIRRNYEPPERYELTNTRDGAPAGEGGSGGSAVSAVCAFVSVIGAPTTAERTMRASCRPVLIGQLLRSGRHC